MKTAVAIGIGLGCLPATTNAPPLHPLHSALLSNAAIVSPWLEGNDAPTSQKATVQATEEIRQRIEAEISASKFNGQVYIWKERFPGDINIAGGSAEKVSADQRLFNIWSVAKQFTALTILRLAEQEKLAINDTLQKFFPHLSGEIASVTLKELMHHTGGITDEYPMGVNPFERDAFISAILKTPLTSGKRGAHHYSNPGYSLLAAVIEKVSGKDFKDVVKEQVFEPAGMTSTAFGGDAVLKSKKPPPIQGPLGQPGNAPSWALLGAGGVWSTGEDLMRFSKATTSGKLISESTAQEYWRAVGYTYGIEIGESFGGIRFARHTGAGMGGSQALYLRLQDNSAGLVILSNEGKISKKLEEYVVALVLSKDSEQAPQNTNQAIFEELKAGARFQIGGTSGGELHFVSVAEGQYSCVMSGASGVAQLVLCPSNHNRHAIADRLLKVAGEIFPEGGTLNAEKLSARCLYPKIANEITRCMDGAQCGARAVLPDDLTSSLYFFIERKNTNDTAMLPLTIMCAPSGDDFLIEAAGPMPEMLKRWKPVPKSLVEARIVATSATEFAGYVPRNDTPTFRIVHGLHQSGASLYLEVQDGSNTLQYPLNKK